MEQITSNDGTVIAFWRSGAGRPLLLGCLGQSERNDRMLPALQVKEHESRVKTAMGEEIFPCAGENRLDIPLRQDRIPSLTCFLPGRPLPHL